MKKIIVILVAALLVSVSQNATAIGAAPSDLDLNNTDNARDTQVEAKVAEGVSPTYVVTIPSKVDFGTLARPAADEESLKTQDFNIQITKLENLGAREVLAILAQGSGVDGAFTLENTKGKALSYKFLEGSSYEDITGRTKYSNGWYVKTSRSTTTTPITCRLSLDQNQLNNGALSEWQGTFVGSVRFYTTIADMDEYIRTAP